MAPLSAPAIRTAARELRAVLYARCRYLLSRVTAHYHACDVPETRPHGTPMIVSRLRLLSSTKCAMAGTDASCYQGHRPGRSKHKKKPVGSPESQSKISEGVGDPRAGASGAMRAPTTRRRKTSRGCACLSLTARLSTLGCWSGGFCRRTTLQPPWAWLNPRPSLTHAALVATSSPPTPPPCHPAPWWARAVPLELQDLQPRWAPWLWRRPSANSVGQRAAILGRGSSLSPTRATRARLRLIEKIQAELN